MAIRHAHISFYSFLVFHGGSGSTKEEISTAVRNGVVKMNVDTDTQFAYLVGMRVSLFVTCLFPHSLCIFQDFFDKKKDYLQTQVGNPEGVDKPNKKVRALKVYIISYGVG